MKFKLILLTLFLLPLVSLFGVSLIKNDPIKEIQEFAVVIEKKGWVSDESRINNKQIYKELDRKGKTVFNNKPFYPISYKNTMLSKFSDRLPSEGLFVFKKAKGIWGYFYRDKNAQEMITDGVIEQWEFASEEDAQTAMKYVQNHGHSIYFNTYPYTCRIKNYMIVFQSRAMAFSYEQKPVYDLFVKIYNPILP